MLLVRSGSYRADLENITDHIAKENPSAALDMWDEIENQVEQLRQFPRSGREGRMEGTRELVVARTPFIVVYTLGEVVTLVRVLHGAQQWPPV